MVLVEKKHSRNLIVVEDWVIMGIKVMEVPVVMEEVMVEMEVRMVMDLVVEKEVVEMVEVVMVEEVMVGVMEVVMVEEVMEEVVMGVVDLVEEVTVVVD